MCVTDVFNEGMNYAWKKRAGGKRGERGKGFPSVPCEKWLISKCETTDINNINLRGQRITF